MSKNAIIFHGTNCRPDDFWYPWLAQQLESKGYIVEVPHYPSINREPIDQLLPQVLENHDFNEETVLIGHSAGGPLLLSLLERTLTPVAQAILVAGFYTRLATDAKLEPVLQDHYDWTKIKQSVKDIIFINSTNDPWGRNDQQGRGMFNQLGGTLIIRNDGHFGSTTHKQLYRTFDLLNRLVP